MFHQIHVITDIAVMQNKIWADHQIRSYQVFHLGKGWFKMWGFHDPNNMIGPGSLLFPTLSILPTLDIWQNPAHNFFKAYFCQISTMINGYINEYFCQSSKFDKNPMTFRNNAGILSYPGRELFVNGNKKKRIKIALSPAHFWTRKIRWETPKHCLGMLPIYHN